jgi:DNA-binding transcriptional LysR family regulator
MPGRNSLTSLDLNLLPILVTVLEEQHITRAAARLGISQPAVSKALGKLRCYFQDDLLTRNPAGYELTVVGNKLLSELNEILPRLQTAINDVSFDPHNTARTFIISASDFTISLLLPHFAPLITKTMLKAVFCTVEINPLTLFNSENIDLFISEKAPHQMYSTIELFTSRIKLLISRDNKFKKDKFTIDEYLQQNHVRVSESAKSRSIVDNHLAVHGLARNYNIATSSIMAAALAVAMTDSVVAVPEIIAHTISRVTGTRVVDPPDEIGEFRMHLFWNPTYDADKGHRWLREIIARLYRDSIQLFQTDDT